MNLSRDSKRIVGYSIEFIASDNQTGTGHGSAHRLGRIDATPIIISVARIYNIIAGLNDLPRDGLRKPRRMEGKNESGNTGRQWASETGPIFRTIRTVARIGGAGNSD